MRSQPILISASWKGRILNLLSLTFFLALSACSEGDDETENVTNEYKQKMREFVQAVSQYGRSAKNNFIIIPQNGQELVTSDGEENGQVSIPYLHAISGVGREDLFYG
jgi:cysteinyl-tRNA synthetase